MKKLILSAWLLVLSMAAIAQTFVVVDKNGNRIAYDVSKLEQITFQTDPPGFTVYEVKEETSAEGPDPGQGGEEPVIEETQYTFDEVQTFSGDPDFLFSHPDTVYIGGEAEYFRFQLRTNVEYTYKLSDGWLKYSKAIADTDSLQFEAEMNPTTKQRIGYIAFASKDKQMADTLWVMQAGISEDLSEFDNIESVIYNDSVQFSDVSTIRQGLVCDHASKIQYYKQGELKATIYLTEPQTIAESEKAEDWGVFQFPGIMRVNENTLLVRWSMHLDEQESWGKTAEAKMSSRVSFDNGKTWVEPDSVYAIPDRGETFLFFKNGGWISTQTPEVVAIDSFPQFPDPIGEYAGKIFYKMYDLPDELQGAYLTAFVNGERKQIHAKIVDPEAIRYAYKGFANVLWLGSFLELDDESIVAGIYSNRICDNIIAPYGISIYKTTDKGENWNYLNDIPYPKSEWKEDKDVEGFSEPALSELSDGSLLCVIRSTEWLDNSPMYKSISTDGGLTWSDPVAFTSNGCAPRLMHLKNGVTVLTYGRPGVQLRFSIDGKANEWTNPIEMMNIIDGEGNINSLASCGYSSIIRAGDNSFYLVYSDFIERDKEKKVFFKKEIKFRKVTIQLTK